MARHPRAQTVWMNQLKARYDAILAKHPKLDRGNHASHRGTLGTGNHVIEVCLDEAESVCSPTSPIPTSPTRRTTPSTSTTTRKPWIGRRTTPAGIAT